MELELYLEATDVTPEVHFNLTENKFSIRGRSMPEDTEKYYNVLIKWLNEKLRNESVSASIDIALDYYNTGTFIRLMAIFNLLHELNEAGNSIKVHWICEADDEDNIADGESFKDVVKVPFYIIEV